MIPINQVILGGDPLLGSSAINSNIEQQLQMLEVYRQNLENAKQVQQNQVQPQKLVWDDIDAEIAPMTEEQKSKLLQDQDYLDTYSRLQTMVQVELLNLVKSKIESTSEGKDLLQSQLKIVKKLKNKIIEDTNREMELFRKFKDYSKANPEITYEEFIKQHI